MLHRYFRPSTRLIVGHLDIVENAGATLTAIRAQIRRTRTSRNSCRIVGRSCRRNITVIHSNWLSEATVHDEDLSETSGELSMMAG